MTKERLWKKNWYRNENSKGDLESKTSGKEKEAMLRLTESVFREVLICALN